MVNLPTTWLHALALAACLAHPLALARSAPEPLALDAQFKPAEQATALLEGTNDSALKGIRRVAVPQFSVEFVTADNVSAETSSFGSAGRASVSGYYALVGVAEPDFQALAEAFHAAFLQQLQAAGLEVVSPAEVAAAPSYRKLAQGGTPTPMRGDSAITVAPPGMVLYGLAKAQQGGGKPGLIGALSNFSAVTSAIAGAGDAVELQKELGGAALLDVTLRVHFAQLTNNNRGFLGRMASTASVSSKVAAAITSARLSVAAGVSGNQITLKRPLVLDPAAFSELRQAPKSAGDVAGAVALGVLRAAIGSKDSHSSEKYEAVADNSKYKEVVGAGLATVGELFTERLKAGR